LLRRLFQKGKIVLDRWLAIHMVQTSPAQASCRMNEPGHRVRGWMRISEQHAWRMFVSHPSRGTVACHQAAPPLVQWPPTHCFRNPPTPNVPARLSRQPIRLHISAAHRREHELTSLTYHLSNHNYCCSFVVCLVWRLKPTCEFRRGVRGHTFTIIFPPTNVYNKLMCLHLSDRVQLHPNHPTCIPSWAVPADVLG
jgi:hypothetical protein